MKNLKTNIKNYALFSYVVLTLLGAYSAAMFYFGTQYSAHASSDVVIIKTNSPK